MEKTRRRNIKRGSVGEKKRKGGRNKRLKIKQAIRLMRAYRGKKKEGEEAGAGN